ncbi:unnamed protein product [Linum trigynum]|uniref:Uncharacterized protein n=1 Tax=Linum trigynum TaxID=586398 RepID=A0AAV2DJ48_9ROSI
MSRSGVVGNQWIGGRGQISEQHEEEEVLQPLSPRRPRPHRRQGRDEGGRMGHRSLLHHFTFLESLDLQLHRCQHALPKEKGESNCRIARE